MIVYPKAVQNEPSVDTTATTTTTATNTSSFQTHSVSFVHTRPNHRNFNHTSVETSYTTNEDDTVSKVKAEKTGPIVVDGKSSYDVSDVRIFCDCVTLS